METIERNVRDLAGSERSALEGLVGHDLRENQRLIIQVTEIDADRTPPSNSLTPFLPDWCNVYAGLSEEDIWDINATIRNRADLTRDLE